jgi:hypothetical protein
MSIYQTSLFGDLAKTAGGLLSGVASGLSGKLGGAVSKAIGGGALGSLAAGAINYGSNAAMSSVVQKLDKLGNKADRKFDKLVSTSFKELGISAFENGQPSDQGLLFAGGLSMKDMQQIVEATDGKTLARKNFYVLEISDGLSGQPVEGVQPHLSKFNLFTQSLDLNPIDISGDVHLLGSASMNIPQQNNLTEMNLVVLDDINGTIKQWARQKLAYTTPSDGTVMPAIYRTFSVRIIYGTNKALDDYYNERYTMELASSNVQLTRTEQALEEISLRFTQESTFMPTRY